MEESECSKCLGCGDRLFENPGAMMFCVNQKCKRYGLYTALVESIPTEGEGK